MGIVTTSLGPNSGQIDYDAGETIDDIMTAIFDFIEAHGWELYDNAAGATAKCYRARNYDNPLGDVESWKYVVIDWSGNIVKLRFYESWDNSAHTGTNLAYYSDQDAFGQPIDTSVGGTMYIFSNYRWLILLALIAGNYGSSTGNSFTGVFEVERANSTDTWDAPDPLVPAFWGSGYRLGGGDHWASGYFSLTRSKTGFTGLHAADNTILASLGVKLGRSLPDHVQTAPTSVNPWTGKNWVFNLVAGHGYPPSGAPVEYRGRVFGLKLVQKGLGANLDTAIIECDSNYFWVEGGTETEHFVLTTPYLNYIIPK